MAASGVWVLNSDVSKASRELLKEMLGGDFPHGGGKVLDVGRVANRLNMALHAAGRS